MILAGDIGGTKTLLGLFDRSPDRPRPQVVREFATSDYADLNAVVGAFTAEYTRGTPAIVAASFGVAGPVTGDTAELTNLAWRADAQQVSRSQRIARVTLLNDLQAMAYAVPVLNGSEVHVIQSGSATGKGNMALIAAGTGLGEAVLHPIHDRWEPIASEGGHADFPARTEREIDLVRDLIQRYGYAEVEHVVSGPGLVNIHRITHTDPCPAVPDLRDPDAPAAISRAALERRCRGCVDALGMFVEAYGAEAGNLALRSLATSGVFVGGGIAPRILPALTDGRFTAAFLHRASPFHKLLAKIPVKVVLNEQAGLLGAAVHAAANT